MRVLVGTSGYSYKQWKGSFYPKGLKEAAMLRFYGERFKTVEINNTFYRMPRADVLERWTQETPPDFSFVLKAPCYITNTKRPADVGDPLSNFLDIASCMGSRLGPVLYQFPPHVKKDLPRLRLLLDLLPESPPAVVEFRDPSWFDDEVHAELRARGVALCQSDSDDLPLAALTATARFGYLRLRRLEYDDAALAHWLSRIEAQPWDAAHVFFKHEDEGRGPDLARRLLAIGH